MRNTFRWQKRLCGFVLLMGILLVALAPGSSSGQTATQGFKPLRVGVSPNSPPMIFKEGKNIVGVEADLAQALGKYLKREVQWVEVPFTELIDDLNSGKFDIGMSAVSVTQARRFRVAFCDPYLRVGQMALVRADEKYRYVLGDVNPSKGVLGVKRGTTADFFAQQEFPKWKRKYFPAGEEAAASLLKKKIDLFISDSPMIWYLAGTWEQQGLTVVPRLFTEEVLAWPIPRSDTALQESANAFLKSARDSGEFDRILRRWVPRFQ